MWSNYGHNPTAPLRGMNNCDNTTKISDKRDRTLVHWPLSIGRRNEKGNCRAICTHIYVDKGEPTMIIIRLTPVSGHPFSFFLYIILFLSFNWMNLFLARRRHIRGNPKRRKHCRSEATTNHDMNSEQPNTFNESHDKEEIIIKLWIISSSAIYFGLIRN